MNVSTPTGWDTYFRGALRDIFVSFDNFVHLRFFPMESISALDSGSLDNFMSNWYIQ